MTPTERIALLRSAKSAGLSPERVWSAMMMGVAGSKMRPAHAAMSKAEWFNAFERVFGKKAAATVRARGYKPL